MRIVITGGAGFLGRRLADRLAAEGSGAGPIDEMVLFDPAAPAERPAGPDPRIRFVAGDVADRARVACSIQPRKSS